MNPVAQQLLGAIILGCVAYTTVAVGRSLISAVRATLAKRHQARPEEAAIDGRDTLLDALSWQHAALSDLMAHHLGRIYSRLNELEAPRRLAVDTGSEPAQAEAAR